MLLVNVYTEFDQWGRMGNRMFQYAFAYLYSKKRNCNFYSSGLPNFNIPGNTIHEPPIGADAIYTRSFGNNRVDTNVLNTTDKNVVVNSFLQKAEYYIDNRADLINLFGAKPYVTNIGVLTLHIRETDYKDIGVFLGYDYYKRLIRDSGFTHVVIVTDNSKCETVQRLVSEGCQLSTHGYVGTFSTVNDERGMEDFYTLLTSENLAISQSSFSWWAAFLGLHKRIIFPYKLDGGMWKLKPGPDDVDLYFDSPWSEKYIQ